MSIKRNLDSIMILLGLLFIFAGVQMNPSEHSLGFAFTIFGVIAFVSGLYMVAFGGS